MTKRSVNGTAAVVLALALAMPAALLARENNPPAKVKVDNSALNRDLRAGNSYASVVKKVTPSVVNIVSTKTVRMPRFHQFFDDPMLERFFGAPPRGRGGGSRNLEQRSLGAGVIVTEDGYILTNNHVVEGADPDGVEVALGDGTQRFKAKVIGNDPQTDIALLKIDAKNLPAITLADSDTLEVGDVVLAVGNPYNVGQTVTLGIVSALRRGGFGITDYEDFIQTDAPINVGNSGGALVDTQGRLVGINQSIVSPSGGNTGIGFAVPINLARSVMDRLVSEGKVLRGYLGVMIQPVTPDLAKAFNLPDTSGALVGGVSPKTPAEQAGLKEGDVITAVNGKKAADSRHVRLMISQNAPGSTIKLTVVRDGKARDVSARLAEMPRSDVGAANGSVGTLGAEKNSEHDGLDGVEVDDLTPPVRQQYSIPNNISGVLVARVDPDSNAYEAGLREGNVIQEIERKTVRTAEEAVRICEQAKGERLLVRVWSNERGNSGSRFLSVDNRAKQK